jgi:putative two-component system response regulator
MAVADVYDALICRRVYKEPIPHPEAVVIMTKGSGTHFDPEIIKAFLDIQDRLLEISKQFSDDDESIEKKAVYMRQALGNPQTIGAELVK